uniref:Uncharacterized protein n=2 Tax=Candidatus Kentrum eta TaxID=2126337 RepID=A0A450VJD3_9GAMM|nr:MAG: hypothetical protein BECKH772A_GA0070896_102047 [Candidatus Kentron sp. H]VFK04865.1 MAG: hypothetical protein BECKH772C_GA0070978_102157 [Candidatus Kentron sp. H]
MGRERARATFREGRTHAPGGPDSRPGRAGLAPREAVGAGYPRPAEALVLLRIAPRVGWAKAPLAGPDHPRGSLAETPEFDV